MVKNLPANAGDLRDTGLIPGLGRPPGVGSGKPTPVFLLGESHGQRNLAGYGLWDRKDSHTTNTFSFTLRFLGSVCY